MANLVLFDIDGTLVASNKNNPHKQAFIDTFKKVFNVVDDDFWNRFSGYTEPMVFKRVFSENGIPREETEKKMKECFKELKRSFKANINDDSYVVLQGVNELLGKLKNKGAIMGLVTGNLEAIAETKLKSVGLWDFFTVGGFGNDNEDRTELVRIATKKANRIKPIDNVTLIGDTPFDIRAGNVAGAKTIAVKTNDRITEEELKKETPNYIFNNLSETQRILDIVLR